MIAVLILFILRKQLLREQVFLQLLRTMINLIQ